MKTFDEIANGPLTIDLHDLHTRPCVLPTVVGMTAARAWLDAHGGFSSLKANHESGQVTGWTIYRAYPDLGHRACGSIYPT